MLTELRIKNFAIIDELQMYFTERLNVISGETGAGKSIIIGAINLLLGDRGSVELIRSSEESAQVEALFDISKSPHVREQLEEMGLLAGEDLLIKRTLSRAGKNKVYINGNLATVGMLASLSESLVNICGQHEHQILLNDAYHIDILDEFGGLTLQRNEFLSKYEEYRNLEARYESLKAANRQKNEREELLRFQVKELQESNLKPDEDCMLQEELKLLNNAQKLRDYADGIYDILYARENSILEEIEKVKNNVARIKEIDRNLEVSEDDMNSVAAVLEEISYTVRDYAQELLFDPERLEIVQERIEYISKLKRKHGKTIEEIFRRKKELEEELQQISFLEEEINGIEAKVALSREKLLEQGIKLSAKRREKAKLLEKAVEKELHEIKMERARFEIRISHCENDISEKKVSFNAKGIDTITFYLTTNPGEEPKPLSRVASGGELSRIVLAMKKVLARTGSVDTVIFDEVDSGIGGAIAEIVGKKLRGVSHHHQVICITHLPQIACFGDTHFLVSKQISGEKTQTKVAILDETERLHEITRMLGGIAVTEKTRDHAYEMLKASRGSML